MMVCSLLDTVNIDEDHAKVSNTFAHVLLPRRVLGCNEVPIVVPNSELFSELITMGSCHD